LAGELVDLLSVVFAGALLLSIAFLLARTVQSWRFPREGSAAARDPGFEGGEPPLDGGHVRSSAIDLGRGALFVVALGCVALLTPVVPACLQLARDGSHGLLRALTPALIVGVTLIVALLHAKGRGLTWRPGAPDQSDELPGERP